MPVEVMPSALERGPEENLAAYIHRGRNECASFGDIPFQAAVWTVDSGSRRLSSSHKVDRLWFMTHEGGEKKNEQDRAPMSEPFVSFLKAFVRLRHEVKPKQPGNHAVIIRAGRYLHDVLSDRGYNPCELRAEDFHAAGNACVKREDSGGSQYRIGSALQEIAAEVCGFNIPLQSFKYKNHLPRPDVDTKIGIEFETRRESKLPDDEVFASLADMSERDADPDDEFKLPPADLIRLRAAELCFIAGFRMNELLTLPVNCLREVRATEKGKPAFNKDGSPRMNLMLRFFPEKGAPPLEKPLPSVGSDIARRAVRDIREITASARAVAQWLEDHPGRAYFAPETPDKQFFTMRELEKALNLQPVSGYPWASQRGVPTLAHEKGSVVRREDVERALLDDLQRLRPEIDGGTLSSNLFLVHPYFLNAQKNTRQCLVELLTDGQMSDFFTGRGPVKSVFERYDHRKNDGSFVSVTSHQFRHFLDTLAEQGHMPAHLIARWFGRKDIGQNSAYNHVSSVTRVENVRALLESGSMRGPIAAIHDRLPPVDRAAFRNAAIPYALETDLGICKTDVSIMPCHKHGSCATCSDHLVKKGDVATLSRTRDLLERQERYLDVLRAEEADGTYNASNHLKHIETFAVGLRRIVKTHEDPSIPDGTLVQVTG